MPGKIHTHTLPKDFISRCEEHYHKAITKHPHFVDALFESSNLQDAERTLVCARALLADAKRDKSVTAEGLLACEIAEAIVEYGKWENDKAIDECYDAIAVIMRIITTIEGR